MESPRNAPLSIRSGILLFACGLIAVTASAQAPNDSVHAGVVNQNRVHSAPDSTQYRIAQAVTASGMQPVPVRNYIDEFIFGKMAKDKIPHAGLATDEEFLRRIHLDLTGRLPAADEVRQFLADKSAGKREQMIDKLMSISADPHAEEGPETPFLSRWSYFFGDLLQVSNNHMARGRNLFHDYVHLALSSNLPYDEMVRDLLTHSARSSFLDGPVNFLAADHVNDSDPLLINQEDTYDAIAITTGKLFLGINLECVSCHDGRGHLEKINLGLSRIPRDQFWRQGAFFSKLQINRVYHNMNEEFSMLERGKGYDVTSSSVQRMPRYKADVSPRFLTTGERPKPDEPWREAFARMLTADPQFARATVNMIWAELMGVGIVDPPFSFDLSRQDPAHPPPAPWTIQPTHPELLNALADDFRAHHFDLRYLMRLITTSSAYQLSSHFDGEWKVAYEPYFARHVVRRLPPEVIADAISDTTGVFNEITIRFSDKKKVKYMTETYAPDDVGGAVREFMKSLGQGNRTVMVEVGAYNGDGSMVEASTLLNSKYVKDRVKSSQEKGRLHDLLKRDPPLSDAAIVDELYLSFLGRLPQTAERGTAIGALQPDRAQGTADVAWALINMPEFLLNY